MAKSAKVRGKEILDELVAKAKTPERQAALKLLADDEEILEGLGDKTLKQDEFSRMANELAVTKQTYDESFRAVQKHHRELTEWEQQNRRFLVLGQEVEKMGGLPALVERGGTRTGGDPEDDEAGDQQARRAKTPPPVDTSKFVTREEAQRMANEINANANGNSRLLNALTSKLAVSYYQEFGQILDVQALYDHCDRNTIRLDKGGYDDFVKGLRHEKAEEKHKLEVKEAEERGMKKGAELAARGDGLPFLVGNGDGGRQVVEREPSVLDILKARKAGKDATEAKAGDASSDVLAAVATYNDLSTKRALGLGNQ